METKEKLLKIVDYLADNSLRFDGIEVKRATHTGIDVLFLDKRGDNDSLMIDTGTKSPTSFHPRIAKLIDEIYSHLPEEVRETKDEKIARLEKENKELKKKSPFGINVIKCPCMPENRIAVVPTMRCPYCNVSYNDFHICPIGYLRLGYVSTKTY